MQLGLNSAQAKILLDIHSALMTWNLDEQAMLQSVCGKLSSLRSGLSIFCALLDDAGDIRVVAAAGAWGAALTGLSLGNKADRDPLGQCVRTGCSALGWTSQDIVPAATLQQEAILHPLTLQGAGIGLIGIVDRKRSRWNPLDPILFQMVAQHTGFALGMLRTLVQRDALIGELQLAAAVQGFLLGRPMPAEQTGKLLATPDWQHKEKS